MRLKMNLKKCVAYCVMVLFVVSFASATATVPAEDPEIAEILTELDGLMKNCRDELVNETYGFVRSKIGSGEVAVVRDKKKPKGSFDLVGFSFSAKNNDSPTIHFYPVAIEVYKKFPSISCTSVIYAYKQCYDFYHNKSFLLINENKLEKLLFERDANHVTGLFISSVLVPEEMESNEYLKDFYKKDNLRNFKMVNLNQLYSYLTFPDKHTLEETLDFYAKEGVAISEKLTITAKGDELTVYQKAVYCKTYADFMPYLVLRAENHKAHKYDSVKDLKLKKNYPEIYSNIKQLEKKYKKHNKVLKSMQKDVFYGSSD